MIIGIFTDTFYPEINGVATSCLNLYQQLQKMGHTVHVYAPKCKGWEEFQSDTLHYLESAQFILLRDRNVAFPGMGTIRQALDMHFDVVHTNSEFVMGFLGTYVARHTGCVRVHTYHTVWEDYTYYVTHGHGDNTAKSLAKRYSEWWCDRFDRVIVPTAKTENLLRQYGVEAPIDIIPSGMDLGRFSPERHSAEEKADFEKAPNGVVGMETSLAATLTGLYHTGTISLMHIVRLMCVNPRKILGIEGGSLGIGDIADIAIFNADESWTVDPEKLHSKSKNTCFKGMTLKGRVKYTLVNGKIVYEDK